MLGKCEKGYFVLHLIYWNTTNVSAYRKQTSALFNSGGVQNMEKRLVIRPISKASGLIHLHSEVQACSWVTITLRWVLITININSLMTCYTISKHIITIHAVVMAKFGGILSLKDTRKISSTCICRMYVEEPWWACGGQIYPSLYWSWTLSLLKSNSFHYLRAQQRQLQ